MQFAIPKGAQVSNCPIRPGSLAGRDTVGVYVNVMLAAVAALAALLAAAAVGTPEAIVVLPAILTLVVVLHPIALPYLLATVVAGYRTAHGPSVDAAWDAVFLLCFAPYFLVLCWFFVRRLRAGRRTDALSLAALAMAYVCVCEFFVLAQTTVVGLG